uniref:Uncharacterized protein n=1 Tax=Anguilla anguilla TaxID=7936 RepID=A0A0E9PLW9_ANGAN
MKNGGFGQGIRGRFFLLFLCPQNCETPNQFPLP